MSAIAVRFDGLRSLAYGSISGTYAAVGTPILHLSRQIKVINNTDADVTVSFDGTTDNDFVPAGSFTLYDFQTNANTNYPFVLPNLTQPYVKTAGSPSMGSVYVTVIYGKGQ